MFCTTGNTTRKYLHDTQDEAEADCVARDELALVRPLDLDQRYYAVYTAEPVLVQTH